jgi:choice-of-anchor A domain-containing protein
MRKFLCGLFLTIVGLSAISASAYTYEGEYSIDNMIRNYRIVSLGQYDNGLDYGGYSKLSNIYYDDMLVSYNNNLKNVVDFRRLNNIIINQQQDILNDSVSRTGSNVYSQGNYTFPVNSGYKYYSNSSDNGNSGFTVLNILDKYYTLSYECWNSDGCSNVILNLPNAVYVHINQDFQGHIIAPKADVLLDEDDVDIYGSIIANNVYHNDSYWLNTKRYHSSTSFYNDNFNDEVDYEPVNTITFEENDYNIGTLLKNYGLVAFGNYTSSPVDVYHIVGSFLVNGNFGVKGKYYYAQSGDIMTQDDMNYSYRKKVDNKLIEGLRLDMRTSNDKYASYINGKINTIAYTPDTLFGGYGDDSKVSRSDRCYGYNGKGYCYDKSFNLTTPIFVSGRAQSNWNRYDYSNNTYILTGSRLALQVNYLDFNKLYNSVIEEQKNIDRGTVITPSGNTASVTVGNNYTINNISDIKYINFDNYNQNESKLTVITINDSGEITMPIENIAWEGTNDYLGKTNIRYAGERILDEDYYGNIVFNIPNATRIIFPEGHPFKGHIIAPKARVEMPEMNIAGCLIVDSVAAAGHSEIHYYPLNNLPLTLVGKNTFKTQIVWADQNDKDAIRPAFVTLKIYVNGALKYTKKVTAADDWVVTLNLEDEDLRGNIEFSVEQDGIAGYTMSLEKLSSNQFVLTNTHTPGTIKGVSENPKTGIFNYLWLLILPIIMMGLGYLYFTKKSFFKNAK